MKKLLAITAALATCWSYTFAQTTASKNSLAVTAGVSVPLGSYGSTAKTNLFYYNPYTHHAGSGYAQAGPNVQVSFTHALNSHWGITGMLYGAQNTINSTTKAQQLNTTGFGAGFFGSTGGGTTPPQPQYEYYPNWHVDKNSWYTAALLAGATFNLPLRANRLSFTATAAAGAAYISMAKIRAYSITDTAAAYITQNSVHAIAPAINVNAGLHYHLSRKISLAFTAGYFATTNALFKNVTLNTATLHGYTATGQLTPQIQQYSSFTQYTSTQKQSVSAITANAGISISL
jgi:hypothetical protein